MPDRDPNLRCETLPEKVRGKVMFEPMTGCWLWIGSQHSRGYGRIPLSWRPRRTIAAHRYVYVALRGEVPAGLELDHLCRNRACVNPDHLEPVTRRVNVLRGSSPNAESAAKTTCKRGHDLSGYNLITRRDRNHRECRQCARMWKRAKKAGRNRPWQWSNSGELSPLGAAVRSNEPALTAKLEGAAQRECASTRQDEAAGAAPDTQEGGGDAARDPEGREEKP